MAAKRELQLMVMGGAQKQNRAAKDDPRGEGLNRCCADRN
jgi:hypothetical protein